MKKATISAVLALGLGFGLIASVIAGPGPGGPGPDGPRRPASGDLGGMVVARGDGGRLQPVGGANVLLSRNSTDNAVARTRTNDDGQFRFEDVRPGRYVIRASKEGVGRGETTGIVRPGGATRVRVLLGGR